ncbi:MAG: GntR family transcriptional regulator [Gammaproteobacteria bacterium]|nr:GntR family transcriptional regulator [Gammaproteobacteria bacterium]
MREAENIHRGRLPLHLEISEMLAREIKAGVLLDGEKLEPERVLAKRLGIAVGTLRKALADLHGNGMLKRIQGSGNYVCNSETDSTIYGFFRLELMEGGGLPGAEVISVDRTVGEDSVQFGRDNDYYRIRRVRYLNQVQAALEEIWLDASLTKSPLTVSDLSASLYQFYKDRLGFWVARVEDALSVSTLPTWTPESVVFNKSTALGCVERQSWDQHNNRVEFSRTWFDPTTVRYVARWK